MQCVLLNYKTVFYSKYDLQLFTLIILLVILSASRFFSMCTFTFWLEIKLSFSWSYYYSSKYYLNINITILIIQNIYLSIHVVIYDLYISCFSLSSNKYCSFQSTRVYCHFLDYNQNQLITY